MVVQKAINNLKGGPKEDKVAVASGIAVSVVIILLAAWAIFFFRGIARGSHNLQVGSTAQDNFNFAGVKEAQQALQQGLSPDNSNARADSTSQNQQPVQMQVSGQQSDQFGTQPGN